jgi:hypothetical protein
MKLIWVVCVLGMMGCVADVETEEPDAESVDPLGYNCDAACMAGYDHARRFCENRGSVPPDFRDACLIAARGGFTILCPRAPEPGCQRACGLGYTRFSAFCGSLPDSKKEEHCRRTASEALATCVNRGSMTFRR